MVKLSDIFSVMSADEYMISDKPGFTALDDAGYVVIYDKKPCEEHGMNIMKRAYKILPGGDLEEVPIEHMLKEVKAALVDRVNVDELLEQVLRTGGPHSLIRTYEILKKYPEVKKDIKAKPGCLFLDIPNPAPGESNEQIYLRF
jgi:hypothetical protein